MPNKSFLSWINCLVVLTACHFQQHVLSSFSHEEFNCSPKIGINCTAYQRSSGCDPPSLTRDFPILFPNTVKRDLWPGSPAYFDVKVKQDEIDRTLQKILLIWLPPSDSSIEDTKGFYVTVTIVEGYRSGVTWCIVVDIQNSTLQMADLNVLFHFTINEAQHSTIYDFRLYSLPLVDPYFNEMVTDMSKYRRVQTSFKSGIITSSDWVADLHCNFVNDSYMEVSFEPPPLSFHMEFFDFVLMYQSKSGDLKTLKRKIIQKKNSKPWYFQVNRAHHQGLYSILVTPKDILQDFLNCVCRNQYDDCVGSCRTSRCYINVSTTAFNGHRPGKLDMIEPSNNTFNNLHLTMDSNMPAEQQMLIMSVTMAMVVITSITTVIIVWFCVHKTRRNENLQEQKQNNSEEMKVMFPSSESRANYQDCEHEVTVDVTKSQIIDSFLKANIDEMDIGDVSETLSEQMFEINESYNRQLKHFNENQTGSAIGIYSESLESFGGKSV